MIIGYQGWKTKLFSLDLFDSHGDIRFYFIFLFDNITDIAEWYQPGNLNYYNVKYNRKKLFLKE